MIVFRFIEAAGWWHWEAWSGGRQLAVGVAHRSISDAEADLTAIVGASTKTGATVAVEHR